MAGRLRQLVANLGNLKPFSVLTEDEQRAIRSKGGKKSVEARRRRRAMREVLDALLQMPLRPGELQDFECLADIINSKGRVNMMNSKVNVTVEQAVLLGQIVLAMQGNTKAATFLRDTAGQKILKDADEQTEYEDDGFTEAIKRSAKDVWK